MVHGLLTASLATQIGGDLDYIARRMVFNYKRPVFVGDTVRCTVTITKAVAHGGRLEVAMAVVSANQHGAVVLTGDSDGVVLLDT